MVESYLSIARGPLTPSLSPPGGARVTGILEGGGERARAIELVVDNPALSPPGGGETGILEGGGARAGTP